MKVKSKIYSTLERERGSSLTYSISRAHTHTHTDIGVVVLKNS